MHDDPLDPMEHGTLRRIERDLCQDAHFIAQFEAFARTPRRRARWREAFAAAQVAAAAVVQFMVAAVLACVFVFLVGASRLADRLPRRPRPRKRHRGPG
ncbi:DUF3040 domain-containing protein [Streptomyces arenae]|nr:DUF3040 domain-containing protein [Streptomyces arenae]